MAAPLAPPQGTLVCNGIPVGNHWPIPLENTYFYFQWKFVVCAYFFVYFRNSLVSLTDSNTSFIEWKNNPLYNCGWWADIKNKPPVKIYRLWCRIPKAVAPVNTRILRWGYLKWAKIIYLYFTRCFPDTQFNG